MGNRRKNILLTGHSRFARIGHQCRLLATHLSVISPHVFHPASGNGSLLSTISGVVRHVQHKLRNAYGRWVNCVGETRKIPCLSGVFSQAHS